MRIDWYTKGVLTIIAVLLGAIAIRPYVSPDAVAHAQGSFAGVEYGDTRFFDSRTGELYSYKENGLTNPAFHYRVNKLGAPLVAVK